MNKNTVQFYFFLLVAFFPLLPFAQTWHPFPSGHTFSYAAESPSLGEQLLFAAAFDSIVPEGGDTAYYLYRMNQAIPPSDSVFNCAGNFIWWNAGMYLNQDHLLGAKALIDSTGLCSFVYSDLDTFWLETQAVVGQSWTFHGLVQASVDSVVWGSVLGQADSLKYLSLSDGRRLVLSLSHGIVEIPNLRPFNRINGPVIPLVLKLRGIEETGLGQKLPDLNSMFDLEPGLVLSYRDDSLYNTFNLEVLYTKREIIGPDTLFPIAYQTMQESALYKQTHGYPLTLYFYIPPIPDQLVIDSGSYTLLNQLPYAYDPASQITSLPKLLLEARINPAPPYRITLQCMIARYPHNAQYDACGDVLIFDETRNEFRTGMGIIRSYNKNLNGFSGHELRCYKFLGDTRPACPSLAPVVGLPDAASVSLTMAPNPVATQLQLDWGGIPGLRNGRLQIHDMAGRIIWETALRADEHAVSVDVGDWPSGMYWVQLTADNLRLAPSKLVVAH